ncbi:hypothetical protein [uncultured Microbacterium sp.]|uniref:hypothetical protein n=1 Tax=uncultured Microbacterium sp. TaxID=191216 RepID=UPI002626A5E5|nr:hypothetical protein [uncultured Microbacterium sp.]
MAAHVLRLRLHLLFGALRGDRRHVTRTLIGLLILIVAVAAVCGAVLRLRTAPVDVALTVSVIAGCAATAGFFAAALVGGFDDQLDPRRFAVFGPAPRPLAGILLLASFVSIPVLALVAVGICVVLLWTAQGAPLGVSVLAVILGILTCVLLAKIALALGGLVLHERRSRELTGIFLIAILVVVVPVLVFFVSLDWDGDVPDALREAVDVLAVTPFGAAAAVPARAIIGGVAGPLVVAVLTVLALAVLWVWLVERVLTTIERPSSGRERAGLGWFAVTPGTPSGGIAARSLIYWLRDPRHLVNLVIVPIAAVVTVLPLILVGVPVPVAALVPVPLMALFFGWLAHNDLAYDSTALWMHLAAAVRGYADRVGRLAPVLLVAVPVLALSVPIAVMVHGRWAILPAMIGVCGSLFLCGLGLSSISSSLAPYPVSRPGDSPFQQPQRTGGGLAQGIVLIGAIVLSLPALWWGWLTLSTDVEYAWTALWGGIAIGLSVLLVGVFGGGAIFDRRGSRLMEFVESI